MQALDGNVSIVTDAPLDDTAQATPSVDAIPSQPNGLRVAKGVDATQSALHWYVAADILCCRAALTLWLLACSCHGQTHAAMQEATAAHLGGCSAGYGGGSTSRRCSRQHFLASLYGGPSGARGELAAKRYKVHVLLVTRRSVHLLHGHHRATAVTVASLVPGRTLHWLTQWRVHRHLAEASLLAGAGCSDARRAGSGGKAAAAAR